MQNIFLQTIKTPFLYLILSILFTNCMEKSTQKSKINPPKANKIPEQLKKHGDIRIDNYYWLNQRENPEVINYLNAENNYTKELLKHTESFQSKLFEEMKGRIKEDDASVPYKKDGYWYITKYETGKDYPIYTRKKEHLDAEEEILFDCNIMAKGKSFFNLGSIAISTNNKLAAFTIDTIGRRQYTLQIKNLETGELLSDIVTNTSGSATWANDNSTLFYTVKDPVTLRSNKIYKHKLGATNNEDALVYEEKDETFYTYVYKTKSKKYLIIGSNSTLTSEFRILDATTPDANFKIFQKRERELEYSISHYKNSFYILTNKDGAQNFKLQKTNENATNKENWIDVIPHRANVLLEDIEIFNDYLILNERENGLNKLRIKSWDQKEDYYLPFDSETYTINIGNNPDFNSTFLRYQYTALNTPSSIIDYDLKVKTKTIKKEQEVLDKNFKKENYTTKRVWATARDGVKVPISLIYKKGTKLDGSSPLLQYGYGSYGNTIDPYFSSIRLSLLDRGFIFAIAHVRGGEYLGRNWYETGKLKQKKNTFTDFVDCSKYLIAEKYTSAQHLYASGGSAGGLLMGVIINTNPELYHGVLAAVPFVDVVTTMLDDSIPLTTGEYDEWGNPNQEDYYKYMLSYSPYDNVVPKKYPNLLVTTGLHDSQVQYWEPAKWVAKLRDVNTSANTILLHTDMDSGHGGASGRFERLKEIALEYAFLLDLENRTQ